MQPDELMPASHQPQGQKLLVIDKDSTLLRLVKQGFVDTPITVHVATNSRQALRQLYAHQPDLILLDDAMEPIDGQPLLTYILEIATIPIILLTNRDNAEEVIQALDQGLIDDYITKPLLLKLLVARVKAFLRTRRRPPVLPATAYADPYLCIDSDNQRVFIQGRLIHLTTAERKLLFYLLTQADRICPYTELLEHTWGWAYRDSTQYVHVYISRLRHKIEPDPKHPCYLRTAHGFGYQFQRQR